VTTEEDFQRELDEHPEDWDTRLVFADWLEERGDPRADGYRAIARQKRRPLKSQRQRENGVVWWWWHRFGGTFYNHVPDDWFDLLPPGPGSKMFWPSQAGPENLRSRRECEDALALAFGRLPEVRRRQLLQPPG
jgi:uncharacterized protein (TIGR02996 family)